MLVKSEQDEIQTFLADASNLAGGHASRVLVLCVPVLGFFAVGVTLDVDVQPHLPRRFCRA